MNPFLQRSGKFRVVGPPGTGKTTWLINTIIAALKDGITDGDTQYEIQGHDITIVAFTKAAAVNAYTRIVAAGVDIPMENVGTLHSLALKQVNDARQDEGKEKPRNLRDAEAVDAFNEAFPNLKIKKAAEGEETDAEATPRGSKDDYPGEELLTRMDTLRARKIPVDAWPNELRAFWPLYVAFKAEQGLMDFTDYIVEAIERQALPPGIAMLLADEAQDFSPLEHDLLTLWSDVASRTAIIGDDDQSIYQGLKGASPEQFINLDVPAENTIVLDQSYRVPLHVHAFASAITDRISNRLPKVYHPRDEAGSLRKVQATWRQPQGIVATVRSRIAQGEQVMILAYGKHMLEPTVKLLREEGIAFHNPFRPSFAFWNPLGSEGGSGVSVTQRFRSFLAGTPGKADWTDEQVLHWLRIMKTKELMPRAKKGETSKRDVLIEALEQEERPELEDYIFPEALERLKARDLEYFISQITSEVTKTERYKLVVSLAREGLLDQEPRVIIGSIHSVKGGEAEHVLLYPDFPDAAKDEDEMYRVMYVGVTRAKKNLILAEPCERKSLPLAELKVAKDRWLAQYQRPQSA